MKKITIIICVLLMLSVICLAACAPKVDNGGTTDTTTTAEQTTTKSETTTAEETTTEETIQTDADGDPIITEGEDDTVGEITTSSESEENTVADVSTSTEGGNENEESTTEEDWGLGLLPA